MNVWTDEYNDRYQLFDCRNIMDDKEASYAQFLEGHLEGAVYVLGYPLLYDINKPVEGRHPLPDLGLFKAYIEKVSDGKMPLAYDDTMYGKDDFMATRFFFLCDLVGIKAQILTKQGDIQCVSGGESMQEYEMMLRNLEYEEVPLDQSKVAQMAEVESIKEDAILIDARDEERYKGIHEPIDRIAGHIPHAENFPFKDVHSRSEDLLAMTRGKEAIVYCGSGMSATPLYAKLKEQDQQVKLFPGSFSAWVYVHPDNIERS